MDRSVIDTITSYADELAAEGPVSDERGQLSDRTVEIMKESRIIQMTQPSSHGGLEAHPVEFAEAVMRLAAIQPAAGWVAGVVGVHPWQLALGTKKNQDEVWGEDPTIWMASPYMPNGMCVPTDGGYRMSGRWGFSSGTDHCRWIFLGAMRCEPDGSITNPPQMLHVVLPRSDYEIVPDSWDVMGLRGTGSKDIVVKDAFIPDHRVQVFDDLLDGSQLRRSGQTAPLYAMPWSAMFPLGITAATVGICEGLLQHIKRYQEKRVNGVGTKIKDDPYTLYALAETMGTLNQARLALLSNAKDLYDMVAAGQEVTFARRAAGRRTQVHAAWSAVRAIDDAYARCGGTALRMDQPLQRFWRDAHAGLHHAIHMPGIPYHASSLTELGVDPQGVLRTMI